MIILLAWFTFIESRKSNKLEDEVSKLQQEIIEKDNAIEQLKRK